MTSLQCLVISGKDLPETACTVLGVTFMTTYARHPVMSCIMTFLDVFIIKTSQFVMTNDVIHHILLSNSAMERLINYSIL